MTPPPDVGRLNDPRTQAGRLRRALHLSMAAAGWLLFFYWWWLVLRRVSHAEMEFTAKFVGIALVAIVTVTVLWVAHNLSIYRRRGARQRARVAAPDTSRDMLGRAVHVDAADDNLSHVALVRVVVDGSMKSYRPSESASERLARQRRLSSGAAGK